MSLVSPSLSIKANDIEAWVDASIEARSRLAVFLRTLVNSTATNLTRVDFPGNDDAQRPGWDGYVDSSQGTPWVPNGISGWEFGTSADVKGKADGDYKKSVDAVSQCDREEMTFVFVTPRRWPGKGGWCTEMHAKGEWKEVRAYDSSDLEQWVEQSIVAQVWFADETSHPFHGVRSLDKAWADWANVSSPALSGSLFKPAVDHAAQTLSSRMSQPTNAPVIIGADSVEEGLAFLAQAFDERGISSLATSRDRVVIFDRPGILPTLAHGSKKFIAVAGCREVEVELAPFVGAMPTIVVCPRNSPNAKPDVTLEPLGFEAFQTSLAEMGCSRDQIAAYDHESGRSLTVLRRRLSSVPAIRTPAWASDYPTASSLLPLSLLGTWVASNADDRTALELLATAGPYDALEREFQRILALNDSPLWSVGAHRGVVSKIDLLFAVAGSATSDCLRRYFELAEMVLGEDDPKLDLPEGRRWAAVLYGKRRSFSPAMRDGVAETLVLLVLHGNHLFQPRLGVDCQGHANRLVRDLLTPLTLRKLEAHEKDLPIYAEAAPEVFLAIIEEDLRGASPASFGLMRPVGAGGTWCTRAGFLWALEVLAWNPETLPRVALVLAHLATIDINDNWTSKPINSLAAVFRVWMPQTGASHEQRLEAIRLIARRFPSVCWRLCISQLETGHSLGHYNYKPRWRTDAHGHGEPFETMAPVVAFSRDLLGIVLAWPNHSRDSLADLLQLLRWLPGSAQAQVCTLVLSWASAASDADKASLREHVRVRVRLRGLGITLGEDRRQHRAVVREVVRSLCPSDLLHRHVWLFREGSGRESADTIRKRGRFDSRQRSLSRRRERALKELVALRGTPVALELARMGGAGWWIGWLLVYEILPEVAVPELLVQSFAMHRAGESCGSELLRGALAAVQKRGLVSVLQKTQGLLVGGEFVALLGFAPFSRSTWSAVDALDDEQQRSVYWNLVEPEMIHDADEERAEAIERLLSAGRPRAAFSCARLHLDRLVPRLVYRVLSEIATNQDEGRERYQLDDYRLQEAFDLCRKSSDVSLEEMALLEFAFVEALAPDHGGRGIPSLETCIEANPQLFVSWVVWSFRRGDGGTDPPEWEVPQERTASLARRGGELLRGLRRLPGRNEAGELDAARVAQWVESVRNECSTLGRLDVGDLSLGRFLAHCPPGKDGVWPCEAVREVLENAQSTHMVDGARTARYNEQGVLRGDIGRREREIAEGYREWANALQFSHPFVASNLLGRLVEAYERNAHAWDEEASIRRRSR